MNSTLPANSPGTPRKSGHPLLLAGISLVLGAAAAGAWFHFQNSASVPNGQLAPQTLNALAHLGRPVVIRFYSLLPANSAGDDLQSFSDRTSALLDQVQNASGGKVQVISVNIPAETNADAATTDGIQPFNLDQGAACFLGAAISSGERKESLARLQPEWEPAVQYDLVRAIDRVAAVPVPPSAPPAIAKPSPEILSSIKQLIPDPAAVSLEDANKVFHAQFMADCAQIGAEMETQINAAQQQLAAAQNGGSPEAAAAAQKHLLEVQLQQGDKMKQVATDLQTRLAVFQKLKAGATNTAQ